jgi:hypothetical protein
MAIRDKMQSSATTYLRPDEQVQAVFCAQTHSQYLMLLSGAVLFLALNRYRIVVATQDRILVLDAGKWTTTRARGVVAELPRSTQLGPTSGVWHQIEFEDSKLRVHRRFHKDIATADAVSATATIA